MSGGTDELKSKYSADKLEIEDDKLREIWEEVIHPNIGALGTDSRSLAAATRGFDARIGVLQNKVANEMKRIMERNEASSKRMERTSYIMLAVALAALIVSIISVIK